MEPHFRRSTGPFLPLLLGPHEHNSPEPPVQPPQHPQSGSQTCQTLQSGPRISLNTSFFRRQVTYPKTSPTGDWVTLSLQRLRCPTRRVSADPPNKDSLRLRPRDAEGRFLPVDAPHPTPTPPCRRHLSRRHPSRSRPPIPRRNCSKSFATTSTTPVPSSAAASSPRASKAIAGRSNTSSQYTIGDWRLHIVEPHEESRLHRSRRNRPRHAHPRRRQSHRNPNADPRRRPRP